MTSTGRFLITSTGPNMTSSLSVGSGMRELRIRVFDIGHGDSILIEFPDGIHVGIVDCQVMQPVLHGTLTATEQSEPKVLKHLRDRIRAGNRCVVAFVCLTHFHADHYTGLWRVLEGLRELRVEIREFWDAGMSRQKAKAMNKAKICRDANGKPVLTSNVRKLGELANLYGEVEKLRKHALEYRPLCAPKRRFQEIAEVQIDVIAPDSYHWGEYIRFLDAPDAGDHARRYPESADEHLACSGLLLRYGSANVLLGADLTSRAWAPLSNKTLVGCLPALVVKVSHHGSVDGNFLIGKRRCRESLWEHISKRKKSVAAISGGYRTKLPHEDTLRELQDKQVTAYCTGNFLGVNLEDPVTHLGLPSEAKQQIQADSDPVFEIHDSCHGDIAIAVTEEGKVDVTTEFPLDPLRVA